MSDDTTIEYASSTNGRVYVDEASPSYAEAREGKAKPRSGVGRLLVPAVIVVTALIVLRRMQRGNYA